MARVANPMATRAGSIQPSLGTWPIPSTAPARKCGARRSAVDAGTSSASTPSWRAAARSLRSRAAPASVYAAFRLPERWKSTDHPISDSKRSSISTAS